MSHAYTARIWKQPSPPPHTVYPPSQTSAQHHTDHSGHHMDHHDYSSSSSSISAGQLTDVVLRRGQTSRHHVTSDPLPSGHAPFSTSTADGQLPLRTSLDSALPKKRVSFKSDESLVKVFEIPNSSAQHHRHFHHSNSSSHSHSSHPCVVKLPVRRLVTRQTLDARNLDLKSALPCTSLQQRYRMLQQGGVRIMSHFRRLNVINQAAVQQRNKVANGVTGSDKRQSNSNTPICGVVTPLNSGHPTTTTSSSSNIIGSTSNISTDTRIRKKSPPPPCITNHSSAPSATNHAHTSLNSSQPSQDTSAATPTALVSAHQRLQGAESAMASLPLRGTVGGVSNNSDSATPAKRRPITSAPSTGPSTLPDQHSGRKLSSDNNPAAMGPLVFSSAILERYTGDQISPRVLRECADQRGVSSALTARRPPQCSSRQTTPTSRHQDLLPKIQISAFQRDLATNAAPPSVIQPARRPSKVMAW